MEEVKAYFGIIIASTLIIFFNIFKYAKPAGTLFRDAAFQVASIVQRADGERVENAVGLEGDEVFCVRFFLCLDIGNEALLAGPL